MKAFLLGTGLEIELAEGLVKELVADLVRKSLEMWAFLLDLSGNFS